MNISSQLEKVNIPIKPRKKQNMRLTSNSRLVKWLRYHETDDYKKKSDDYLDEFESCPGRYKILYSEGGRLVELKRILGHEPSELKSSKRNIIDGYSRESRNRFLKTLISINYSIMGIPLFYTLTYPGEYSNNPKRWKRDLETFVKRLERIYPELSGTWRLEPQRRGAPHFSGFLWGCDDLSTMEGKKRFSQMWFEVVGSGDEKHLRAGTGIDKAEGDLMKWIFYMAKYQTKIEKGGVSQEFDYPVGRYWGLFNRKKISISKQEFEVDRNIFFKVRRIIKKQLEKKLTKNKYREVVSGKSNGLWISMSNETIFKLINLIVGNEESEGKNEDRKKWNNAGYGPGSAVVRCC
jgi:hypothetical protein